jgi:hypothetical protein
MEAWFINLPIGKFILNVEKTGFVPYSEEIEIEADFITYLKKIWRVRLQGRKLC